MKNHNVWVGIVIAAAVVLFGVSLFLLGDQHKAFHAKTDYYADFISVDGITKGSKVRVSGMDAGQVQDIVIPPSPAQKFRVKITLDNHLRGLVRTDSIVSVETSGLVGDKFLLVREGSEGAAEAASGATLPSKEPFDMGKMLDQANGLLTQVGGTLTQVNGTITDVQGRLDGALGAVTKTVNNTNGLVTDVRHGKGTAGMLLEDPATAADVRQAVVNTRTATESLDATMKQVNGMVTDAQQRQLVAKVDDTLNSTKGAARQLDETAQQVHQTLGSAFAPDGFGQDAGANLRQSLTNVNAATGNLADDTEALKHEFFFKGFFKKRGYNNLDQLPTEPYRSGKILGKRVETRQLIEATPLFVEGANGTETLSAQGRAELDEAASRIENLYDEPLIVEGYADGGTAGQMLVLSRERALLVRKYLQVKFGLAPKDTGIVGLSGTPPEKAGKSSWNGVCLVHVEPRK